METIELSPVESGFSVRNEKHSQTLGTLALPAGRVAKFGDVFPKPRTGKTSLEFPASSALCHNRAKPRRVYGEQWISEERFTEPG
jgi:hypothetical protein